MFLSVRSVISLRSVLTFFAGVCAMLAVLSFSTLPAFAHDHLLEADPADGTSIEAADFTTVTLTFSGEPLDLGNQMVVKDADGSVLFEGEPTIEGSKVIAELTATPAAGAATVQWRVASSDGHPISGELTYTVVGNAADGSETQSSDSASDAGGETIAPLETPSAQAAQNEPAEQERSQGWTWWLPVLALGVLATVAGGYLYRQDKRRRRH